MNKKSKITTAIVIPARNEAQRIGSCLRALEPQLDNTGLIVLVANNCTDATVHVARETLPGPRLLVLDCNLEADQGVGTARRLGCSMATRAAPDLQTLMTTDADCLPEPDWIASNLNHLHQVDAVCGAVFPIEEERSILCDMPVQQGQDEADYHALVLQFYALVYPEPHNPLPHHGGAPGASFAVALQAYAKVGGFSDLRTGEDRDLVRRLRQAGYLIRHAANVRVAASCRLTGRAPGGMAQALRDRLEGVAYRVDDALPPADWLRDCAHQGTLPMWPPQLPEWLRLRPQDLPEQILKLKALLQGMSQPRFPGAGPLNVTEHLPGSNASVSEGKECQLQ